MEQVNGLKSNALFFDAAYMINDEFQVAARLDMYKPNTTVDVRGTAETVGVNYFILNNAAKIQAAFTFLNNLTGANGAVSSSAANVISGAKGTIFTLGFQANI